MEIYFRFSSEDNVELSLSVTLTSSLNNETQQAASSSSYTGKSIISFTFWSTFHNSMLYPTLTKSSVDSLESQRILTWDAMGREKWTKVFCRSPPPLQKKKHLKHSDITAPVKCLYKV